MPCVRCNRLLTQSFMPTLSAAMACALAESGDQPESREGADTVLEARCGTVCRVPRWPAGTDQQRVRVPPGTGGQRRTAEPQGHVGRCRAIRQGGPPRRGRRCRADEARYRPWPGCSCS
jgi:hypothetical protein